MSLSSVRPPLAGHDAKPIAADTGNTRAASDKLFALLFAAAGDAGALAGDAPGGAREAAATATETAATELGLALIVASPLSAATPASDARAENGDADEAGNALLASIGAPAPAANGGTGRPAADGGVAALPRSALAPSNSALSTRVAADDAVAADKTAKETARTPVHPAAFLPESAEALRDARATATDTAPAAGGSAAAATPTVPHGATRQEPVATTPVRIETPVAAPGWGTEVAQKLTPVVLLRNERAELQLNPAHLGPVEVKISFSAEGPSLVISAADAGTRSALEQSLPHLRDLLAAQGITLGQATVQSETRQPPQAFATPAATRPDAVVTEPETTRAVVRIERLVDVFA